MYEHTTTELAEYLGIDRQNIYHHIRSGFIKSTYIKKLNCPPRLYISHKEYIKFCDWHAGNRYKKCGVAYKKTPNIDEYDLEPKRFNSYVSLAIQRNKSILENKYLNRKKYIEIALDFNLKVETIQQIVSKNIETNFAKKLIVRYENSMIKIDECKKIRKTPNVDEYEESNKMYLDSVLVKIERDKEILEVKYLNSYSTKDIAIKFKMTSHSIYQIVAKNKETKFVKELKKMRDIFV